MLARESILMAKATKHYGKWRIRWVDENGERRSEVFDDRREAVFQLQQRELEAEERRCGLEVAPSEPQRLLRREDRDAREVVENERTALSSQSPRSARPRRRVHVFC